MQAHVDQLSWTLGQRIWSAWMMCLGGPPHWVVQLPENVGGKYVHKHGTNVSV